MGGKLLHGPAATDSNPIDIESSPRRPVLAVLAGFGPALPMLYHSLRHTHARLMILNERRYQTVHELRHSPNFLARTYAILMPRNLPDISPNRVCRGAERTWPWSAPPRASALPSGGAATVFAALGAAGRPGKARRHAYFSKNKCS